MAWSKAFTVRSNARRAARKDGCNPGSVRSCPGGYQYELRSSSKAAKPKAKDKPATTKGAKPTKPRASGESGDKTAKVLEMILQPGGANLKDICTATDWLPHTARARISGIVKANKLAITRTRLLGVSVYQAKRKAA